MVKIKKSKDWIYYRREVLKWLKSIKRGKYVIIYDFLGSMWKMHMIDEF